MKKIALGLIVTLLLLACATSQKYDKQMQGWIGKSEASLVEAWGRPSAQKYLSPTAKVITYTKVSDLIIPSEYYLYDENGPFTDVVYDPFMNDYDFTPYAQMIDTEVEEICQTSFWIENGIITSWKWRGNNCVAD